MDRIPKFRRKPKKPTIEPPVERSSSDTADSTASADPPAALQVQHPPAKNPSPKPHKKSPFRKLYSRNSAKRARESPPTELPTEPPPAVVTLEGIKSCGSPPGTAHGEAKRNAGERPRIPAFLALSGQDIEFKFQELTWAERDRLMEGAQNEAVDDFRWGFFKQVDAQEKGVMDRYFNIKPWNHNRVKLQVPENELDYVNASAITLCSPSHPEQPPLRYIAMQGPTEPSLSYVWRMIAEQLSSPAVIVQLTTMSENGAVKCHQYFPDSEEHSTWTLNEHNTWGDDWRAQLTYDSYEELVDGAIERRRLLLHVDGEQEPRLVWHFLYRNWPDFGVPELKDLESFFELMRLSREHSSPDDPRIIHCSAGVGRTGTFITLEHLMRELDLGGLEMPRDATEQPDRVYETVDCLREQRYGMVQGKPQLQFIYQVMRKLWQDKYGAEKDGGEPAAKRLEVSNPSLDEGPGPDAYDVGIAR